MTSTMMMTAPSKGKNSTTAETNFQETGNNNRGGSSAQNSYIIPGSLDEAN